MEPETVFIAVDLVLVAVRDSQPRVALINRPPESGIVGWGLPGAFVLVDERVHEAATRIAKTKLGFIDPLRLRPLAVADEPGRDPRGRVVSLPHLALSADLPSLAAQAAWATASLRDGQWALATPEGPAELAVDHGQIVNDGLNTLQAMLDHTDPGVEPAAELLPQEFTVRDLLGVYEAFRDQALQPKPYDINSFRRRVNGHPQLQVTDELEELESGQTHRPGRLVRFRTPS